MENVIEGNTELEILRGNLLICNFMNEGIIAVRAQYHTSWDWLHGAWDKLKAIQLKEWEGDGVKWNHDFSNYLLRVSNAMAHLTILDTFNHLVIAIQWHNANTQTK